MKKRISIVPKGNEKALCYAALVILTETQAKKLASESLLKQLDDMAIKMAIEWAVEMSGDYEVLVISRTTFSNVEEEMLKDIERTAHRFLTSVDKLELPKPEPKLEPECPSHESNDEVILSKKEFVERLLHDLNLPKNDDRHVRGALIIDTTTHPFCPELTGWGNMSYDLLKEMCELYLAAHEKDQ